MKMSSTHKLPISRPAIGVVGKTGYWRLKRPEVNYVKCIKCGICWLYCPDSSINILGDPSKYVEVDYNYCKGCGICSNVCPVKAVTMTEE
ncbi:MAG: 4Fe-4S binding protein [Sulfolobales archaeon]|nr:4Fe-4S binding protein [Sulfolobales archaeon]